jgi:hypothetical protein
MTIEQIDTVHKARPFRPFRIHMADGTSVPVPHPEMMFRTRGGRTVFVNTGGENVEIIDLLLVTKITMGNGARREGAGRLA